MKQYSQQRENYEVILILFLDVNHLDSLTTDCAFNDIIPGVLSKILLKRKNLKIIISTARKLDILKFKDIFEEEQTEEDSNLIKCSIVTVDDYKISLSLKSLLPPV